MARYRKYSMEFQIFSRTIGQIFWEEWASERFDGFILICAVWRHFAASITCHL
jgi:hypothetical protein